MVLFFVLQRGCAGSIRALGGCSCCIVISSEAEKSFLQTDERCMLENTQHQGVASVQAHV